MKSSIKSIVSLSAALLYVVFIVAPAAAHATTVNMSTYASYCSGTGVSHSGSATYDVCIESFAQALAAAKTALNAGGSTYTINIDAGTYDLSAETLSNHSTAKGVIDVSTIWPSALGATLQITGSATASTVLITDNSLVTVWGTHVQHIHFSNIFFQRDNPTTTFGTVTSSCDTGGGANATGQITISIPSGFPTVASIYHGLGNGQMFVRAYDNSTPTNPTPSQLTDANGVTNNQIMWGNNTAPSGSGQNWTIYFDNATAPVPLFYCNTGMVVAVKSKFAGDAYNFVNTGGTGVTGTDVGFDHVTWQDEGRGAFRNITYAFVTNSAIVQRPAIMESYGSQAWVLSTPSGGPQIGNVLDTSFSIANATVSNFTAANTGDDSIAFFNDGYSSGTGTISTVTISNSFSRDINLYNSCHVALSGLNITGCNSQQFDVPTQYNGCVTDTDQLVQASWKVPECSPNYPL